MSELLQRIAARHPALSRDEEQDLAGRVRAGDHVARERLVRHSLAFALKAARKYVVDPGFDLDDAQSAAAAGLVRAIDRFDPTRGFRLTTYAAHWIRAELEMARRGATTVRPQMHHKAGTVAHLPLLSSLDQPIGESRDITPLDELEDDAVQVPEIYDLAERAKVVRDIAESLARGNPRARDLIECRILADEPDTLAAVGERWGTSREWPRQVEERLRRKLVGRIREAIEP